MPQAPGRFQALGDFIFRKDDILGNAANPVRTGANVVHLSGRHGAAVAANATAVAGGVAILKARRRGEIESCECARFSEGVTGKDVSIKLSATDSGQPTG